VKDVTNLLKKFPNINRDALIPMLQEVQDTFGYIPEEAIIKIGEYLDLPESKIFGLATFYNQFRFSPKGKYHICLCNGTACHMEGSQMIYEELKKRLKIGDGETTRDGLFSIEILSCIGACGHAPVMSVNNKYYRNVKKEEIKEIIESYRELDESNEK